MGIAPLTVSFSATGSDADGDDLSYLWTFGDEHSGDDTSTSENTTHTYNVQGTYFPTLVVSDGTETYEEQWTITVTAPENVLSCIGFEPPLASGPVSVRKKRVLLLKAQLLDADGMLVTDLDLVAPPVIEVAFESVPQEAMDVSDEALAVGLGTDGNQFEYDPSDERWRFNLKTTNYTALGSYTIRMVSGDVSEYTIDPTCTAVFVIE